MINYNMGSELKLHGYLYFLHEGPWLCNEKRMYVRKSRSMTLNEALRTMCGLRTGGWSLPGVMSDRQCCVD
jgi:hypothetical protein